MNKIARTFRFNKDIPKKILLLQKLYSEKYSVKVSQAEVIEILINQQYKSINQKYKEE